MNNLIVLQFILIFFFGASFGSFINVLVLRIHDKEKGIIRGRSKCPKCLHTLGALDLIPLFSFIFLRGKCKYCKKPISFTYFLMEIVTGLLWVLTLIPYYMVLEQKMWLPLLYLFIVVNMLIIIAVYDMRYLEIPNKFTFPFIFILILSLFFPFTPALIDGILASLILFGFFYLQILIPYFIYAFRKSRYDILKDIFLLPFWFVLQILSPNKWFSKEDDTDESPKDLVEWIGFGDLRIAVIMGLILGIKFSFLALFISYISGAIIGVLFLRNKKKKSFTQIPFAPFLTFGTFVVLIFGNMLLTYYYQYIDYISGFFI